jgi:hypothetical protein
MTAIERFGLWLGQQILAGVEGFRALPGRMQVALVVAAALCATVLVPVWVREWADRRELRRLLAARHAKLRWGPGVWR